MAVGMLTTMYKINNRDLLYSTGNNWTSLLSQTVKNLPAMWEIRVQSLGWDGPLRKWQPTPVFLPGEAHGQRSLDSPRGRKELDTTAQLVLS